MTEHQYLQTHLPGHRISEVTKRVVLAAARELPHASPGQLAGLCGVSRTSAYRILDAVDHDQPGLYFRDGDDPRERLWTADRPDYDGTYPARTPDGKVWERYAVEVSPCSAWVVRADRRGPKASRPVVGGYLMVELWEGERREQVREHRVIAASVHGLQQGHVLHLNHNPADNHPTNLRYGDPRQNRQESHLDTRRRKRLPYVPIPGEIWCPLVVEGTLVPAYELSTHGRIRHVASGRIQRQTQWDYPVSTVTIDGLGLSILVHRAMAWTFLGPPPEINIIVHHFDHERRNNRIENLEWSTRPANYWLAYFAGRMPHLLRPDQVIALRARHQAGERMETVRTEMRLGKSQAMNALRRVTYAEVGGPFYQGRHEHGRQKLSDAKVVAMRVEADRGVPYKAIADKYGVGRQYVSDIATGSARAKADGPITNRGRHNPSTIRRGENHPRATISDQERAGIIDRLTQGDAPAEIYQTSHISYDIIAGESAKLDIEKGARDASRNPPAQVRERAPRSQNDLSDAEQAEVVDMLKGLKNHYGAATRVSTELLRGSLGLVSRILKKDGATGRAIYDRIKEAWARVAHLPVDAAQTSGKNSLSQAEQHEFCEILKALFDVADLHSIARLLEINPPQLRKLKRGEGGTSTRRLVLAREALQRLKR